MTFLKLLALLLVPSLGDLVSPLAENNEAHNLLSKKETLSFVKSIKIKDQSPYCKLCCINIKSETIGKNCGSHTLCKYPAKKTGPACRGYIEIAFTHMEKETIVDAHNTIRNKVASGDEIRGAPGPQPTASNMRMFQWSRELAEVAERWAAQCIYNNDECRDLESFPVGQNIARGTVADTNELSFIKLWSDEVELFNASEVNNFKLLKGRRHVSGRYTQLVWADTYLIGCARAVFQHSRGSNVVYHENAICNYGPSGNIPNLPVYKVGVPCSLCPEGTACSNFYRSLCEGVSIGNLLVFDEEKGHLNGSFYTFKNRFLIYSYICSLFIFYLK